MSASETSSPVRDDQREISLKASVSDTVTVKLRMKLGWYFFSNIKPVKKLHLFLAGGLYWIFHWGQKWCLSRSHTCKKFLPIFRADIPTTSSHYQELFQMEQYQEEMYESRS